MPRPPKLSVPPLQEVQVEQNCRCKGNPILLFSILFEASFKQPQRSQREFFCRPVLPTRQTYLTRLLVNFLWFSRNYFNLALLIFFIFVFFYPLFLLIVAGSCAMHFMGPRTFEETSENCNSQYKKFLCITNRSLPEVLLVTLQLSCCILVCYVSGLFPVMACVFSIAVPVIAHAFFTPYTDEAFELYCGILQQKELPLPKLHSPTCAPSSADSLQETVLEGRCFSLSPHSSKSENKCTPVSRHSFALQSKLRSKNSLSSFGSSPLSATT